MIYKFDPRLALSSFSKKKPSFLASFFIARGSNPLAGSSPLRLLHQHNGDVVDIGAGRPCLDETACCQERVV